VVVGALVRGDQHRLVLRAPLHLHTRVCPLVTLPSCSQAAYILPNKLGIFCHFFKGGVLQVRCHDLCAVLFDRGRKCKRVQLGSSLIDHGELLVSLFAFVNWGQDRSHVRQRGRDK